MRHAAACVRLFLLSVLVLSPLASRAAELAATGPLADYVAKRDDAFQWRKVREGNVASAKFVELRMTSQVWRGITWKHQLFILKPASMSPDAKHALLFVAGGSWKPELDAETGEFKAPREATVLALAAEQLKAPVAIVTHIPFQPIFEGKVEDAIIAYTFDEYLKTRDPEWPLLLPMVKSAVRAMDAVEAFVKDEWQTKIERFTISGGSKRGWTTWLTGAVDSRAAAIAPMVIDVLNMGPQMQHQVATWGAPSRMIHDYTQRGIDKKFPTDEGKALLSIVDPYSYRERLTQPKLIILGTNDPYWPLDALNLYWDGLVGQKHVLYIPNNGHGLKDVPRLVGGLSALHQQAAGGKSLPKLQWKFRPEATHLALDVASDVAPERVDTWIATAPTKDFREAQWKSTPARRTKDGYVCELQLPATGYASMFGEYVFQGENSLPYYLSTGVKIVEPRAAQ